MSAEVAQAKPPGQVAAVPAGQLGMKLVGTTVSPRDEINGYVFWGLTKPGRQNTLDRMDHFFRRYSEVATQLARVPEQKAGCLERVRKHIAQLQAVAQ